MTRMLLTWHAIRLRLEPWIMCVLTSPLSFHRSIPFHSTIPVQSIPPFHSIVPVHRIQTSKVQQSVYTCTLFSTLNPCWSWHRWAVSWVYMEQSWKSGFRLIMQRSYDVNNDVLGITYNAGINDSQKAPYEEVVYAYVAASWLLTIGSSLSAKRASSYFNFRSWFICIP